MRQFQDAAGKTWEVRVNGGTIKRVQDLLGVDLGKLLDGTPPLLTRIHTDIIFLVDLVYVVLKPQADAAGISDEQFAELLEGDALLAAHDALMEELADFFQKLRQTHLATAIEKQGTIVAQAIDRADDVIRAIDLETATAAIPTPPQKAPGSSAADLEPLPGAIPAREPSAS